jgi:hypothetical protein
MKINVFHLLTDRQQGEVIEFVLQKLTTDPELAKRAKEILEIKLPEQKDDGSEIARLAKKF